MKITFLEAEVPLTKTFRLVEGQIDKDGHPKVIDYLSHHYDVSHASLAEFYEKLKAHAALGHCWQKGNTTGKLTWNSRAKQSNPMEPTRLLLLDFDGVRTFTDIGAALRLLGLGHVDYIIQYSSSMGVLPDKGLSAHVFVLLDREYLPAELKEWLKFKNFTVPELASGIALTKNGNALRWTLDITTCQADKLIYIAPPICETGVTDSFSGERIQLVEGTQRFAALDTSGYTAESNSVRIQDKLDALRKAAGLENRKWNRTKTERGEDYMPNPDTAIVTGVKDRGTYISVNLNGGDSWGYWHGKEDPYFLYNFKGEPKYRLKDIVPEYWAALRRDAKQELRRDGLVYLAFRDFEGSTYYNGTFDPEKQELKLAAAKGEEQIRDYLRENGQPEPDVIPTFDLRYDPSVRERVNLSEKWVNLYQPSEWERRYEALAEKPKVTEPPKWWDRIFLSACGSDPACAEKFMNDVACVIQYKEPNGIERHKTAWVLQGIQGTGKGLIYNELLYHALGSTNVLEKSMEELQSEFNGFLEGKLLLFVDEGQMDEQKRTEMLKSAFKRYITEPRLSLRHMRQMHKSGPNYLFIVVCSNKNGVQLDDDSDRRWNVAPYQETKLPHGEVMRCMPEIREQAWQMYCYLKQRAADRDLLCSAMENDAKRDLAAMSQNSIEKTCKAIREGNYTFFEAEVQNSTQGLHGREQDVAIEFKDVVTKMKDYTALKREELLALFMWTVGENTPRGAIKFSNMLKQHRVPWKQCRRGDDQFKGVPITWR